jgi:hypothetical protein
MFPLDELMRRFKATQGNDEPPMDVPPDLLQGEGNTITAAPIQNDWEKAGYTKFPWKQLPDIKPTVDASTEANRLDTLQKSRSEIAGRPFEFRDFLGSLLFGHDYLNLMNARKNQQLGVLGDQEEFTRKNLTDARQEALQRQIMQYNDAQHTNQANENYFRNADLMGIKNTGRPAAMDPREKARLGALGRVEGEFQGNLGNMRSAGVSQPEIDQSAKIMSTKFDALKSMMYPIIQKMNSGQMLSPAEQQQLDTGLQQLQQLNR